jgi:hypothetical protein
MIVRLLVMIFSCPFEHRTKGKPFFYILMVSFAIWYSVPS